MALVDPEQEGLLKKCKRKKYGNCRTQVDGRWFDSRREAERYKLLRAMERNGNISGLQCQVPYKIVVNGKLICRYIADFAYQEDGKTICEDSKGCKTQVFLLKRKLMSAVFGIEIRET